MSIYPKSKLGILGSGQLGRMFAIEAIQMGYEVYSYSPDENSPASKVGAKSFIGEYDDNSKILSFLNSIDSLSFEFENISENCLNLLEDYLKNRNIPICPNPNSIRIAQNRFKEKSLFKELNLEVTNFYYIDSYQSFEDQKNKIQFPCILKTNRFGYDGKGQTKFQNLIELEEFLKAKNDFDYLIEEIVNFEEELSIIAARFSSGKKFYYKPSENIHKNHILDFTIHPANTPESVLIQAFQSVSKLMDKLDYIGVLGLEFFRVGDKLICNEFAPRPHNSGHFSMDASSISQFKLQLLTMTDREPNWDFEIIPAKKSIMKNIIGFDFLNYDNLYKELLKKENYFYHDYQKEEIKEGRKMGHINYIGDFSLEESFPIN